MAVTVILHDFWFVGSEQKLLTDKFQSLPPVRYPISYQILCASFATLTTNSWTVYEEEKIKEPRMGPSGLFLSCKKLFDIYLRLVRDYDGFIEDDSLQEGLWKNCRATDFYGEQPEEMKTAFNSLFKTGVFKSKDKLKELENEELNQVNRATRNIDNDMIGEGPYTNRVLNWLKYVNGLEGGDDWGDHALVFYFEIKRTSSDYHGNEYQDDLLPMLCSCKYMKYFYENKRKEKKLK